MRPVLIYQMGKVGSGSISAAVRPHRAFIHAHGPRQYKIPSDTAKDQLILTWKRLCGQDLRWQIITGTREPIANNIAAFFQNITRRISPWYVGPRELVEALPMSELIACFMQRRFIGCHEWPLMWFDRRLKSQTGIDVYRRAFQPRKGYAFYQNSRARVLLIRQEDLSRVGRQLIARFLGIPLDDFHLGFENTSQKKWYHSIKVAFEAGFEAPPDYLDEMYQSTYATHFYSKAEIGAFRKKWQSKERIYELV